jgi:hypothetical protein
MKKGLSCFFFDLRDNPIGSFKVGHLVFAVWKSSPIGLGAGEGKFVVRPVLEANVVWSFGSVGFWPGAAFGTVGLESVFDWVAVCFLANAEGGVAVLGEVLRQELIVEVDGVFG